MQEVNINTVCTALYQFYKAAIKERVSVDDVRFYWISQEAVSLVLTIGSPEPESPPTFYVL
ncbi:MAG: hypothetical protein KA714_22640 [Limnoraphis sp. WC205]|nr:hypothetical protein [Limnoraphis sp. WC205]